MNDAVIEALDATATPTGGASSLPAPRLSPRVVVPVFLLVLLVLSVFGQTVRHDFISFDDFEYIAENPVVSLGLTPSGVWRAIEGPLVANYHPLTILSHMVDVSIFGLSPAGHHAMNVVLHLLASVALFLLVEAMVASASVGLLVAALFAVHPLHVEPVAWASSRKDLLCALFWFLSMWAWVGYAREGGRRRYAASLFFAFLSMMSKPMAVTLPLMLLMLDWWPLRRVAVSWTRAIVEKVPFLLLSVATAALTVAMQEKGGAFNGTEELAMPSRLANAVVSYVAYLAKTAWPSGLAVFYPHPNFLPETALPAWKIALSIACLSGISAVAWRERLRRPHLLFGWSFFVVTLVPAIGIVQVGGQAMADRYTYVPLVGIFVALVVECRDRIVGRGKSWHRAGIAFAMVGVVALSVVSFRQAALWRDGELLYRHTIAVTGPNPLMHRVLGEHYIGLKRFDDAKTAFGEAIRIRPDDLASTNWLAVAYLETGDFMEAERILRGTIDVAPRYAPTWKNLGWVLSLQGRIPEAIEAYGVVTREEPDRPVSWLALGTAKGSAGDHLGAIEAFSRAVALEPMLEAAWYNLGVVLIETGDMAGADAAERRLRTLGSRLADRLQLEIFLHRKEAGSR